MCSICTAAKSGDNQKSILYDLKKGRRNDLENE